MTDAPFGRLIAPLMRPRIKPSWYLAGGIAPDLCRAAYDPGSADTLVKSYLNIARPGTNDTVLGIIPSLNGGWVFTGTEWLDTGIIPAAGMSAIVQYADLPEPIPTARVLFGSQTAGGGQATFTIGTLSFIGDPYRSYYNGGLLAIPQPAHPSGIIGFAGQTAYFNDAAEPGSIEAWTGTNSTPITIGCYNYSGVKAYFLIGKIKRLAIYDTVLTSTQYFAIRKAILKLR